jgi:hypothetical protein
MLVIGGCVEGVEAAVGDFVQRVAPAKAALQLQASPEIMIYRGRQPIVVGNCDGLDLIHVIEP